MGKLIDKYRPAAASFLLMLAVSIPATALSFLNEPVSQELGVGMGSFTLYYSLMVASGALTMPVIGQMIGKIGVKKLALVCALWAGIGFFLLSFATQLWMFYLIGIVIGILCSAAVNLCANVVLQTYYRTAEAASMIGIVMAGSGVGGMLFSAVMPSVLSGFGWRMSFRVLGVSWAVLIALAMIVLGNPTPVQEKTTAANHTDGMTKAEALRSPVLYLMLVSVFFLTFGSGISQHLPKVISHNGFSAEQTGVLMSLYTAVLAIGKILQGMLYAKAGFRKGGALTHIAFIAGFLLLRQMETSYPAMVLVAIGMGVLTTFVPVLSKELFGAKEYAAIYSIVAMAMSIGTFAATPVWGFVYDLTGSYNLGLIGVSVLIGTAFVCQMTALKLRSSQKQSNS